MIHHVVACRTDKPYHVKDGMAHCKTCDYSIILSQYKRLDVLGTPVYRASAVSEMNYYGKIMMDHVMICKTSNAFNIKDNRLYCKICNYSSEQKLTTMDHVMSKQCSAIVERQAKSSDPYNFTLEDGPNNSEYVTKSF